MIFAFIEIDGNFEYSTTFRNKVASASQSALYPLVLKTLLIILIVVQT